MRARTDTEFITPDVPVPSDPMPRASSVLRRVFVLSAAAWGAPMLHAQEANAFHALVFTSGATTMSVSGLNGMLTNARFAGLSNDGVSYGLSGYYAYGRALLGGDVSKTAYGEEGLSNGRSDDLNATQMLATVSYAVVATRRMNVFPTLGIGTGRFDVTLHARDGAAVSVPAPTFDEVAQSPGASTMLSGHHLLFSLGGGADVLITRRASDMGGIVLGVRGGYLVAPNRTTWTSNGGPVVTGPDASAGGPFLRIVIGVGGR